MADNVTTPIPTSTKFKSKDTGANGHLMGHTLYDSSEGEILGTKADNKSTATDTTSVSFMSVFKQISASIQAAAASLAAAIPAGSAIIGKVGIDQTTPGTTDRVTAGGMTLIDVTLSLDTSAYASGDLLADTQAVANAVRVNDGKGILHSVTVIDEDDQGVAFDLYFLSANNSLGTENAAPSISDANARDMLCIVPIATTDYRDLGGVRVASVYGLNRIIKGVSGGTSIYVAAVNGSGTPTFTASGLKLRIGIVQD